MKTLAKIIGGGAIIFILAGAAFSWYMLQLLNPVDPSAQEMQRFIVPKGQSVTVTAQKLQAQGLINNATLFRLLVRKEGIAGQFQAGTFELSPAMSARDIAYTLTQGTEDVWITLLEGWRREEMADYLENQELNQFDKAEFLRLTEDLEGQLLPETYLVSKDSSTQQIVSLLQNTFESRVIDDLQADIQASDFTVEEILTLASLVQREAKTYDQMRRVSGILQNRLDIGMPLQVDATLQYAKGYNEQAQEWWSEPLAQDKTINSPYNTYQNNGLPIGPICNPGLEAIKSVLNPLASDDLFYLHAPTGEMYYAQTLDEHNANINRYLR